MPIRPWCLAIPSGLVLPAPASRPYHGIQLRSQHQRIGEQRGWKGPAAVESNPTACGRISPVQTVPGKSIVQPLSKTTHPN